MRSEVMGHSSGAELVPTSQLDQTLMMAHASSRPLAASRAAARPRRAGQSVVEFAIVVPVLFFIVIAVADFGRLYTAAVAIESAAREAADYGAFDADHWSSTTPANITNTLAEMEKRACTAAAGSHLEGYVGASDNTTCTNPRFSCTLEWGGASEACGTSAGMVAGNDCSALATQPKAVDACTVHVRLDYDFRVILGLVPFPDTFPLGRDSRYRIADLTP
jgi:Flp pilus assembly protein TadG